MIDITDKHNCCGCSACVQACPKHCISFEEDNQGFRYPLVNRADCIDCGLCERVCPVLNQLKPQKPMKAYAAINPDNKIRMKSSSGGIFTMLAEKILSEGGVVFGARFDENWEVKHDFTETLDGLEAFRGSKYLQSRIGETYSLAKEFLLKNRKVLFTGTPCQIAGLKKFLLKEYDNLLTVDIVCHGTPSPLVWRTYLKDCMKHPFGVNHKNTVSSSLAHTSSITDITFRDKSTGWKNYSFVLRAFSKSEDNSEFSSDYTSDDNGILVHDTFKNNLYMQIFLNNLCLRPSCSRCPAKSGMSSSDLTIADYWGIDKILPTYDDDKGTSLILVNSLLGQKFLDSIQIKRKETSYEDALRGNSSIEQSVQETPNVVKFWRHFHKHGLQNIEKLYDSFKPSLLRRLIMRIKYEAHKVLYSE